MPTAIRPQARASLLEKSREEVKKLVTVIEHLAEAVIITDARRRVTYINPAAEKMLGYSASEMIGRPSSRFFEGVPGNPPRLADTIASEAIDLQSWNGEVFDRHKNGRVFPVRLTLAPIHNRVPLGCAGIASDLRETKRSQMELMRNRETLSLLSDAVVIADGRGRIIYLNPAAERMLGCRAGNLDRRPFSVLFNRTVPAPAIPPAPGVAAGPMVWQGEASFRRGRGASFPAEILVKKVRDSAGSDIGYLAIIRDLSLPRRLEREIGQLKKMEAVSLLAGGLAHDFNNYLQMILGSVESARLTPRSRSDLSGRLRAIEESARRASALCRSLLAFARPRKASLRSVNVNALVGESAALLRRSLPASVAVRTELSPRLPSVRCNPEQIQQIFFNLAINAAEAMKKSGELAFLTSLRELAPADADLRRAAPGRYVVIAVRDRGPGIPPRILKKIFEPFFTTHPCDGKTGLGLAVSNSIVRSHGGFLDVRSAPGRGATFEVLLPTFRPGRLAGKGLGWG